MKILFLANRTPYPPYRGDKLKIYNLARRLASRHEVYLLTFAQSAEDLSYKAELEKIFKEVHLVHLPKWKSVLNCALGIFSFIPFQLLYFRSARMKKALADFLGKTEVDVIHTQHLRMSQYTASLNGPRILDLPDAFSMYWKRRAGLKTNVFTRLFNNWEYHKVVQYEKIIRRFDLNLVCSAEDREFLVKEHHYDRVDILPNGVDQDAFASRNHDYSIPGRIIFTGNMDYAPNIDAVCYFVEEILPMVRKEVPGVKFYIVGQRPVKKVLDLQSEDVIITGFVKDLAAEYNNSTVAVSPIRIGAGTLNKVLEAMSMGIPVVCTHVGFQGLGIRSGEGAVLADNTEDFTRELVSLMKDEQRRREVGQKGIEVIRDHFTWETITQRLEGYFEDVVKNGNKGIS